MRGDRLLGPVAGLAAAAFAILTLLPPGPAVIAPPDGLADRLFPGVPLGWALLRLACLSLAVATAWPWLRRPEAPATRAHPDPGPPVHPRCHPTGGALALAFACALASAGVWRMREALPPWAQLLWLGSLALPAIVLGLADPRSARAAPADPRSACAAPADMASARRPAPGWLGPLAVVAVWLVLRAALGAGDLRPARLVDLWESFGWMQAALAEASNPLLAAGQPGIANVYMLAVGHPFLYDGGPSDLARLRLVHLGWLATSALCLADLARQLLPRRCAALVVAAYLFSPFVLALSLSPSPFGVFLALGTASLALLARHWQRGSAAARVGVATLLGLALMSAYLWPLVAAGAVALVLRRPPLAPREPSPEHRRAGLRAASAAVALLAFFVAALASLPSLRAAGEMPERYVARAGPWVTLERILLGQAPVAVEGRDDLWTREASDPTAVALGAALSPFAAPRTPLRLWLDGLFDPLTTLLAALGLVACIAWAREAVGARRQGIAGWSGRVTRSHALVLLLGVCLVPAALASAYDRTSLLRNLLLPVPVALLAGAGWLALERRVRGEVPGRRAVWRSGPLVAVALAGSFVFDVLTPGRLPDAATGIVLEATAGQSASGRLWLEIATPRPIPWLYGEPILTQLADAPLRVVPWTGVASLQAASVVTPELVFWSPGLEEQEGVARALCRQWPHSQLYLMQDASGLSRAFAAALSAGASPAAPWVPRLPQTRYGRLPCGSWLEATQATETPAGSGPR